MMTRRVTVSILTLVLAPLLVPAALAQEEYVPRYEPDYALTLDAQRLQEEQRQFDLAYELAMEELAAQEAAAIAAVEAEETIAGLDRVIESQLGQITRLEDRNKVLWGEIQGLSVQLEEAAAKNEALAGEVDALSSDRWLYAALGALAVLALAVFGLIVWRIARRTAVAE